MRQTDLKRLIAYSSVSHMGLVLVGIGSVGISEGTLSVTGLNGAAMQLFTHGTVTGLLFLSVGWFTKGLTLGTSQTWEGWPVGCLWWRWPC
ncbi:MAG: hypothetical protein Ct9H300mP11_23070 [Chloroflexota bacterium]|nr:MAG: hypothetical protein Ct9H300mP11_23070 [Chloroflexota bacterium]